ncbi:unnamed protein product, partial [Iphiclides podalirius]
MLWVGAPEINLRKFQAVKISQTSTSYSARNSTGRRSESRAGTAHVLGPTHTKVGEYATPTADRTTGCERGKSMEC